MLLPAADIALLVLDAPATKPRAQLPAYMAKPSLPFSTDGSLGTILGWWVPRCHWWGVRGAALGPAALGLAGWPASWLTDRRARGP